MWASGIGDTYSVEALDHLAENDILCDTCWHSGLHPVAPSEHAVGPQELLSFILYLGTEFQAHVNGKDMIYQACKIKIKRTKQ